MGTDTTHFHNMMRALYPESAEIFLIRDLRDVLCSVMAFNAKRGFASFFYDTVSSTYDYIKLLRDQAALWLANWKVRGSSSLYLTYEDLIQKTPETLSRLCDYLKIDGSPEQIAAVVAHATAGPGLSFHLTSRDVASSIGRWKYDLDDDVKVMCSELLGDVLHEMGYQQ